MYVYPKRDAYLSDSPVHWILRNHCGAFASLCLETERPVTHHEAHKNEGGISFQMMS